MIDNESIIYSVLHDFLTIRDCGKPFYGYSILFEFFDLDESQLNHLRALTENYPVNGSVNKATDLLLEEWIKIIDLQTLINENTLYQRSKYLQSR